MINLSSIFTNRKYWICENFRLFRSLTDLHVLNYILITISLFLVNACMSDTQSLQARLLMNSVKFPWRKLVLNTFWCIFPTKVVLLCCIFHDVLYLGIYEMEDRSTSYGCQTIYQIWAKQRENMESVAPTHILNAVYVFIL